MVHMLIPLCLKVVYSLFMATLVPVYWYNYGPTNFLYFCDVCLLITLVGIWREDPLLISMCTVGILIPQAFWVVDFLAHLTGHNLTGMTAYMFNPQASLFLRGLSFFHGWLPFLLAFLVYRLGYDSRGLPAWTLTAWALLLICFFLMPGPDPSAGLKPVNINYVWGMSDAAAQTWMPTWAWFCTLMVGLPLIVFLPTHFVLKWLVPKAAGN
jgi:hypothetical protein